MANFYVGQRVRVVGKYAPSSARVGAEGIIVAPFVIYRGGRHYDWEVEIDGEAGWIFPNDQLAPLTDPSAERFIESIKRLGREPVNDVPKVTVTK